MTNTPLEFSRSKVRIATVAVIALTALATSSVGSIIRADNSGLPDPGFEIVQGRTDATVAAIEAAAINE